MTSSAKVVFKLCLVVCHLSPGLSFQPEFVRSFLSRPWMLTNQSLNDPQTDKPLNQATVSLYFDNWSPYHLDLISDEIRDGTFSTGLLPHDLSQFSRGLALRSVSSKETKKSSGLIAWTLLENQLQLARLSIAWEIGNGVGSRFSIQLSDTLPQYEEMWTTNKYSDRAMSNNLDDTVYVGGMHKLRFVVAANMTMNEGDTLHYRLRVSFVPSNIDVWAWVKYYREPYELSLQTTQSTPTKPPIPPKSEEYGMFEQKHLLKNDTELQLLSKQNMSLKEAMIKAKDASIALGLVIENWSAYPLSTPNLKIEMGTILSNDTTLPAPSSVPAGTTDVGVILQSKALTGTSGVLRYTLGSTDTVLSIMWTVPYNRQLWRTWVAVGLSSHANQPTYKEMYTEENDSRYIRRQAGQRFEFSDGKFVIIVDMDGDSSYRPVLRVGLVPRDDSLLASNIRQQLGLKPSLIKTPESDFNYQKTEQHKRQHSQEDTLPSVGLIQTGSGSQERTVLVSALVWLMSMLISMLK